LLRRRKKTPNRADIHSTANEVMKTSEGNFVRLFMRPVAQKGILHRGFYNDTVGQATRFVRSGKPSQNITGLKRGGNLL
jgi:hypothetical protein